MAVYPSSCPGGIRTPTCDPTCYGSAVDRLRRCSRRVSSCWPPRPSAASTRQQSSMPLPPGAASTARSRTRCAPNPCGPLDRLVALRLVERVTPVTHTGRSRRTRYRVADNFLAFWLQVLTRFRAEIERGLGETILPVLVESLPDFLGPRWEDMFRSHLRLLARGGKLGEGIVGIGPWWSADSRVEIDAVALAGRSRRPVLAGEAKWASRVDAERAVRTLHVKAAALPGVSPKRMQLALCARESVDNAPIRRTRRHRRRHLPAAVTGSAVAWSGHL